MLAYLFVIVEMAPELLMHNFFHAAVVQSSVTVMVILSVGNRLVNCCDCALLGMVIRIWPSWVTFPGAARSAGQSMMTGTMRSVGMNGVRFVICSTPFWAMATFVSAWHNWLSHGSILATW